jgi:hypothetical protein
MVKGAEAHAQLAQHDSWSSLQLADQGHPLFPSLAPWPPALPQAEHRGLI